MMRERNNKYFQRSYALLKGVFAAMLFIALLANSCEKANLPVPEVQKPIGDKENVTIGDVSIPKVLDIQRNGVTTLPGKAYQKDDQLQLTLLADPSQVVTLGIDNGKVGFPSDLKETAYHVNLLRGAVSHRIGEVTFNYVFRADIPDKDAKNIKGVVHSQGKGIANAVVSDGYDVTTTDADGIYYLSSTKKTGYVFVSIPSNYEVVDYKNNLPLFYKFVNTNPAVIDTRDFELKAVNNENHVILSLADAHLANRNDDVSQFQSGFIQDVNEQVTRLEAEGKKVYALTLGDQTWETYWYSNHFMLPEFVEQISKLNAPVFNTIGNHDNDPYFANDWMSENTYRRILGPTYYSFNLGKVHYIVLDNIEYINNGASNGHVGDRKYNAKITDNQLEWLTKDLASIPSEMSIVLATHIPLHNAPTTQTGLPSYQTSNAAQLVSALSRFQKVHVMNGHTHVNYRVERSENFIEYNQAAICATWWWTGRRGYAGNHISPDGSPGGYGIWEMQGSDIQWAYKSISYAPNYQFRSYDLNNVHITADKYTPDAEGEYQSLVSSYAFEFAKVNKNNEVLLNVWGYDPKWTISVSENGKPLQVERISTRDPLHIISYGMRRLNVNAKPTFDAANTSHMFKVKASNPTSTLDIKVTDRFGMTYVETMQRPKAFHYAMQ